MLDLVKFSIGRNVKDLIFQNLVTNKLWHRALIGPQVWSVVFSPLKCITERASCIVQFSTINWQKFQAGCVVGRTCRKALNYPSAAPGDRARLVCIMSVLTVCWLTLLKRVHVLSLCSWSLDEINLTTPTVYVGTGVVLIPTGVALIPTGVVTHRWFYISNNWSFSLRADEVL